MNAAGYWMLGAFEHADLRFISMHGPRYDSFLDAAAVPKHDAWPQATVYY
jgi:hypothetical protein